jgi:hypothetical protein
MQMMARAVTLECRTRGTKNAGPILALIGLGFSLFFPIAAQADVPPDPTNMDRLRAAYLFSFAKLIDWPSTVETGRFTFCFIGARGVRDALVSGTAGRTLGTRAIATRNVSAAASPVGCQVLYIQSSDAEKVLTGDAVTSVLTVGDGKPFTQKGGILALFEDHNHLRFDLNLDNARRAGVVIQPELIKAAANVAGTAP